MRFERRGSDYVSHPRGPVSGRVRVPGSKSLTNRHLLMAALADGRSVLQGASLADDALAMIDGLRQFGIAIDIRTDEGRFEVQGARGMPPAHEADINVGPAGTAMRFLTALAALGHGRFRLDGTPRMRQRPIAELGEALRQAGAGLEYERQAGFPPLVVHGRGLTGGLIEFQRPPSSQFLSALLMVAPYAASDAFVRIVGDVPSQPYVAMTIDAMRVVGVEVLHSDSSRYVVPASQRYRAETIAIEPDASAATYFWTAAAVTGGDVCVQGLSRESRQGDVGFVDVLARMGCHVESGAEGIRVRGPSPGGLRGIDVNLNAMPDTVQTLAVAALFANSPTTIRDVANLRLKETDRLAALESELRKLGARVAAHDDGITIEPPAGKTPAEVECFDDHRMAMSLALAGLCIEGVHLRKCECVSKSFPDYFDVMNQLGVLGEA